MSLDFLIGLLLGSSIGVLAFPLALKRYLKNKIRLRRFIGEAYHVRLLPAICRVEGMLELYHLENPENPKLRDTYISIALKEIKLHKMRVQDTIKEYEPFQ